MRYNVAGLLQDDVGAIRTYELDEPPYVVEPGVETTAPLRGTVKLMKTNRSIVADAHLSTRVRQECSRCLEEMTSPVRIHVADEYFPTVDLRTGVSAHIPDDETGFKLTETHELDLAEPVRQAILLEQPMKPLCSAKCKGLCPRCGHNLNLGACDCAPEPVDPRLGRLAEWLQSNKKN